MQRDILSFSLGTQIYAVDIHTVQEIQRWQDPIKLPLASSHFSGAINVRGTILPIISLAKRLNLADAETTERSAAIILTTPQAKFGIPVDTALDIATIDEARIQPVPPAMAAEFEGLIQGLYVQKDAIIHLVDAELIPGPKAAASDKVQ